MLLVLSLTVTNEHVILLLQQLESIIEASEGNAVLTSDNKGTGCNSKYFCLITSHKDNILELRGISE